MPDPLTVDDDVVVVVVDATRARVAIAVRVAVGAAVTVCIGVTTLVVWAIGFGRYSEDLCITAVEIPRGAGGSRGPVWRSPVSYDCDFGKAGVVATTDWFPLVGTLVGAGAALMLVATTWWLLLHARSVDGATTGPAAGEAVPPVRPPPMRSGS